MIPEVKRPYPEDDLVNASVHNIAREIDRILNRQSIQDHAAILGMLQVTTQRRAHEYEQRRTQEQQKARQQAKFGIQ